MGGRIKLITQFSVSRGHCPRSTVAVPAPAKQFEKTKPIVTTEYGRQNTEYRRKKLKTKPMLK